MANKRAAARRAKITKRFVDSVEIPGVEGKYGILYWDTELSGFGLRVFPTGRKVYIVDYFDKRRKQRRLSLGKHGVLTPDKARELAKDTLYSVRVGKDPMEEREAARGAITFRALAEDYIRLRCSEKKSGAEDARIIRRELLPHWGRRLAADVSRRDVKRLTAEIKKRGAPIMANRTQSCIRRLYNWGVDREDVQANPAARIRPLVKETSRERVLSNSEIRSFWNVLERVPAEPESRAALKFILITAQRPGEVVSLEWAEINFEERVWNLPAEKSKNGRAHRIPLSPLAIETLASLRHDSNFVFPSHRNSGRHITRAAIGRALRNGRALIKADRFSPHDLRRTAASKMAEMGIGRLTISKILNHTDKAITAIYDRYGYLPEMESALNSWADKLLAIVEGEAKAKIYPMAR